MKFTINFGNRKGGNNQAGEEVKRHENAMRNLQKQEGDLKREVENIMREMDNLQRTNRLDIPRRNQMQKRIDDIKGMISRVMNEIQRERENHRKRMESLNRR